MRKKKKIGNFSERRAFFNEVYDTEVCCAKCATRLYISLDGASLVSASLRRTGVAGLRCLCGHIQFIDALLQPLVAPTSSKRNNA